MPDVVILGAGEIAAATARALALGGRVGSISLIDDQANIASGKALDLQQAGPIGRFDTRIEGSNDFAIAAGARAVVLADAASGGEWSGETALGLLRRLSRMGCFERSVLICAGAGHRAVIQQSFDELRLSRSRVIGSAPEAMASIAKSLVAIEAHGSASQITLTVLGDPAGRIVVPWQEASIAGHSIASLLTPPQLARVTARMKALWPAGPSTLGAAAAVFCEAVALGSRRLLSAFVSLDRDNGTKAPVCAWPVTIGPDGLERVTMPALTGRDRVILDEVLGNEAHES